MKKILLVLTLALSLGALLLALTSCGGHEHTWHVEATIDREATCTEDGQKSIKCIDCLEKNPSSIVVIPATHRWGTEFTVDTAATCTTPGSKSVKCTVCQASNAATVTEIPVTPHTYSATLTADTAPTCTTDGQMSKKCTACNAVDPTSIIVIPAAHAWAELPTFDVEKTCTTDGQISLKCLNCGEMDAESITVVPASHEWADAATVDKESTCTEAGQRSIKCTACNAKKTDSITTIPASHTATYETITVTTMFTNGLKRGVCTVCGNVDEQVTNKTLANVKILDSGNTQTTVIKYNFAQDIRGSEHFYPTEEHPEGQDLYYELTFLWNETLKRSNNGYIEFGRFANSGGANGDIPFFLMFKDSASTKMFCQFAGGFEPDGVDKNREGTDNGIYYGPQMPDGRPAGSTATKADYPMIGDYGWHRIGVQVHQEVKIVGESVKYELTATLYLDGVMVSSYAYAPGNDLNLLYTATVVNGELEYEDVNGGYFYLYRIGNSETTGGKAYVAVGDISITVGDGFVLDVEPVESPVKENYIHDGVTLDGTVHFRVK